MLGYRAVFRAQDRPDRLLDQSVREFRHWLSTKAGVQYDGSTVEFGVATEFSAGARALLVEERDENGNHAVRSTLTEENEKGRWTTRLTVCAVPAANPWVWLDVDGPETDAEGSEPQWISTPGLAKAMLGVADACDGSAVLPLRPISVAGSISTERLVQIVRDPNRRGLAFLAAAPEGVDVGDWSATVSDVLRDTVGLAGAYLLDAKDAARFAASVGPTHAVAPGSIRSFARWANPSDPLDATRHRAHAIDHPLTDADVRHLRRLLGWQARKVNLRRPLPESLTALDLYLERLTNSLASRSYAAALPRPRGPVGDAQKARSARISITRTTNCQSCGDY